MVIDRLLDEYDRLRRQPSIHIRGRALEHLVKTLFRLNHFDVTQNPGAASPRQTDLLARNESRTYLIEITSRKRPAEVGSIDGLFTRLDETPSDVVGIFVSLAGFSGKAIKRVESRRNRSVLLIAGHEFQSLLTSPATLNQVLERKYDDLLTHRKAMIELAEAELAALPLRRYSIGRGPQEFLLRDGTRTKVLSCRGGVEKFVFVHRLADIDWISAGGAGVSIDFGLRFGGRKALRAILGELGAIGWTSENGSWKISQAQSNWHGFTAAGLLAAVDDWRKRYAGAGRVHHSEEAIYYDEFDGGFYTFVASIDTRSRAVDTIDISFQLIGVPLDEQPFRRLRKSFAVEGQSYFRPRVEKSVSTQWFEREPSPRVAAIAQVVQRETVPAAKAEEWVTGIVIRNPFPKKPPEPVPDWWPQSLSTSELIICSLGSWHTAGDRHGGYYLRRFEWTWTSDALVVRVVADWLDSPQKGTAADRRAIRFPSREKPSELSGRTRLSRISSPRSATHPRKRRVTD